MYQRANLLVIVHEQDRLAAERCVRRRDLRTRSSICRDQWEIDLERRPVLRFGVHPDRPPALLHDPVHRGQPQPGAEMRLLGREEGLEDSLARGRIHPVSGVRNGQHGVPPGVEVEPMMRRPGVDGGGGRLDGQPAAAGHRVPGVDDEVHHHLAQLIGVSVHPAVFGRERCRQLHVVGDEP